MRGCIIKRSRNSYSIKIALGKDSSTGKYKYQWVTVRGSKKDAEKRLAELLHQLDMGNYIKPGKITLAEYLDQWLANYAKPNLSPRTLEGYEQIVRHCVVPKLGNCALIQLKPEQLQHFYSEELNIGLSAQTVRHHHTLLHKVLETAVEWNFVTRNIADAVKPPRAQRQEMQTWDEQELNQFLKAAKTTPYYELFYLALFTGMRRSELLALRWQDIDLIYGQLSVNRSLHQLKDGRFVFTQPKSVRSRRTIALPPSVILLLKEYYDNQRMDCALLGIPLNDDTLIFNMLGKPLRPNTITRAWSMVAAKAGVKRIRFHDARHTHASLMLKQGIHPKIVQERLGHSSIQITLDTYSHVAPGLQEVAAQRFDDIVTVRHNNKAVTKA